MNCCCYCCCCCSCCCCCCCCCCCWLEQVISGGQLSEILTIWLTAWLRTIPLSLVTVNYSRAVETEPLITVEFVDHSSIFRTCVSLHWTILQCVLDRYTTWNNFICTKTHTQCSCRSGAQMNRQDDLFNSAQFYKTHRLTLPRQLNTVQLSNNRTKQH